MKKQPYHYKESGLEHVFLVSGYEYVGSQGGRTVVIKDLDGLHVAIGLELVNKRKRLTGLELRFLRTELLLSQAGLATILGVKELTIGRWERGETEIPLSSDAVVRAMFVENRVKKQSRISELLQRIADLEDEIDRTLSLSDENGRWKVLAKPVHAAA